MTKIGQKLVKIAQKLRCFLVHFHFILLKFLRVVDWPPVASPGADYAPG